jgi:GNAT superfamily N-acetyltransferase
VTLDLVTFVEMLAPDQLRPGRPAPRLAIRAEHDVSLIRSIHDRVGTPHQWSSLSWSNQRWAEELARPDLHYWVGWVGQEPVGLLALSTPADGDCEIDTFGLVPEHIGQGLGGHFLTVAVRLAWKLGATRVWLHTSSRDHRHALANYLARGFRPYRTETPDRPVSA